MFLQQENLKNKDTLTSKVAFYPVASYKVTGACVGEFANELEPSILYNDRRQFT